MARLNEAPLSAETLDALKRRFVRQNRELARNNSTQSQRIRNLELETSRLLGENIHLRERIIQLETELDSSRNSYATAKVDAIKDRLDAKIQELGGLVAELGLLQKPARKARRRTQSPKRSPNQKEWKNAHTLAEVMGGQQGGRLPTIVEDKHYPRRTLEAIEIRRLSMDPADDSPDLGPPPVARFEQEDPIKFDPKAQSGLEDVELNLDLEDLPAALSANLETRKKRRDGQVRPVIKCINRFEPAHIQEEVMSAKSVEEFVAQPLRTGAKRKLSARDDGDQRTAARSRKSDDFSFSRKAATGPKSEQENDMVAPLALIPASHVASSMVEKEVQLPTQPARTVLGPKSVNTDPVLSPKKPAKQSVSDGKDDLKKDLLSKKEMASSGRREQKPVVLVAPPLEIVQPLPETVDIRLDALKLPPKTPAGLDLLSPVSTEPSAARPESRDTPPPQDLGQAASMSESNPAGGRPGRRARVAVSYAEPSLISKLRRPTKDLVDAVGREERHSATAAQDSAMAIGESKDISAMRKVVIKKERGTEPEQAWKNLPPAPNPEHLQPGQGSPLSHKPSVPDAYERNTQAADPWRVTDGPGDGKEGQESEKPTGPAAAISALINADRGRKQSQQQQASDEDLEKAMKNLDIYDFDESSPADTVAADRQPAKTRGVRRHSSVSTSSSAPPTTNGASKRSDSAGTTSRERQRGRRDTADMGTAGMGGAGNDGKTAGARGLKTVRSVANLPGGTETLGRGERATARRRSMML